MNGHDFRAVPRHSLGQVLVLLAGAFLSACAASHLETEEAREVRAAKPLQRALRLAVELRGEDAALYGDKSQWENDLRHFLDALKVSEVPISDASLEPDMELAVVVSPVQAKPTVVPEGALLDVLIWMTVPFLPLWIKDVEVEPGLRVEIQLSPVVEEMDSGSQVSSKRPPPDPVDLHSVPTNMLERYPFFSWETLGAVLLPPFVFQHGDAEHMGAEIGDEVRWQAALEIAGLVKRVDPQELLTDVSIEVLPNGEVELSFRFNSALGGEVRLTANGAIPLGPPVFVQPDYAKPLVVRLVAISSEHVKLLARRRGDDTVVSYTITVPLPAGAELP